jgi:hypothetical protein
LGQNWAVGFRAAWQAGQLRLSTGPAGVPHRSQNRDFSDIGASHREHFRFSTWTLSICEAL